MVVLEVKEVGVVGEKGSNSSSKYNVVCWQGGAVPNLRLLPDAQEPKSSRYVCVGVCVCQGWGGGCVGDRGAHGWLARDGTAQLTGGLFPKRQDS
jgi:hypothetical protein